ncbi:MAG: substrate-binding domain-containing protein [Anaerolineae bacterium]|nr:substrate-binding domain-containing protein [Anaerolineae bacterium]
MKSIWRRGGILVLFALFITAGLATAQDDAVQIVGSGIVNPLYEAFQTASGAAINATTSLTGTRGGLDQFCLGQADVATASRPISADENKNCTANSVDYLELLVAHNIIAFIASPNAGVPQCLEQTALNTIFAPSAQLADWNQIDPANVSLPLTVALPPATSATYLVLDELIEGDGLRADAAQLGSDSDVVAAVTQSDGTLGVVSSAVAAAAGDTVRVLDLNAGTGCFAPSADSVEQRLYTAANSLFFYVNRASLTKPGLQDVLNYALGTDAATTISELELTAPTALISETNLQTLAGTGNPRPFSEATSAFNIPGDVSGQVIIAGSAAASEYVKSITDSFTAQYPGVTFDTRTLGQPAGVRRLCNGELDIAITDAPLTDEQAQNCAANNITTLPVSLGSRAVVLVSNVASDFLTCLTTEQLQTTWGAASANTVETWNQVDPAFPEQAMTLFAPNSGASYSDILLDAAILRGDTEQNDDALYRAAATANVEGALTYMSWQQYQSVLGNNQERIQLVAVDAGSGCVTPDVQTIVDGSYALAQPVQLLVNRAALTKVHVQSFLWFVASDDNYGVLDGTGLTGVTFGSLPALRQSLEAAYIEAASAASQPAAEATPEATPSS